MLRVLERTRFRLGDSCNFPPHKVKAKAAHAEMMLRGFSQKHLGRRTITKILTSTISPLLTYALEAFPLNTSDYDLIDEVLEEIISKTTRHHSKHTTWNFYEQHITPPSEIIRRNKISLHIKAKNSKTGLLKELYQTLPNNFLSKEVNMIESTWGFDSNQIIQQYKGEKIIPKQIIALLLDARIDNHLESTLNESNWNVYKEKQHPAALPLNLNNPTPTYSTLGQNSYSTHTQPNAPYAKCKPITQPRTSSFNANTHGN
jgi:hypothetical protein